MPGRLRPFRGYWSIENTEPWAEMFVVKRMSAVAIAKEVGADPTTVTTWLKKHGLHVRQGMHRKLREPPKISADLAKLLGDGAEEVLRFIDEHVWGISATPDGLEQLTNYCKLVALPLEVGVVDAAASCKVVRDTIRKWVLGTDQPYLAKAADSVLHVEKVPNHKLLPLHLIAGGNAQSGWIQVPTRIQDAGEISTILKQITPLERTFERSEKFGLSKESIERMRVELFAYALAMVLGDAGKEGGQQKRATSTNLDLVFTQKQGTNELLGEFTCMCINSIGLEMERIKDKAPSGDTRRSRNPTDAYRWTSERSPLLAWMMQVALGLSDDQRTSTHQVNMEWIFNAPREFRLRFIQGLADSDGSVKPYEVVITSVPNADLVTKLLQSLEMTTAHTLYENGVPLRTQVNRKQAATLPIFNEIVQGYRYRKNLDDKRP